MHVIAKWIEREQAKYELLSIRSALIVLAKIYGTKQF